MNDHLKNYEESIRADECAKVHQRLAAVAKRVFKLSLDAGRLVADIDKWIFPEEVSQTDGKEWCAGSVSSNDLPCPCGLDAIHVAHYFDRTATPKAKRKAVLVTPQDCTLVFSILKNTQTAMNATQIARNTKQGVRTVAETLRQLGDAVVEKPHGKWKAAPAEPAEDGAST
jgi:hypothetical protein